MGTPAQRSVQACQAVEACQSPAAATCGKLLQLRMLLCLLCGVLQLASDVEAEHDICVYGSICILGVDRQLADAAVWAGSHCFLLLACVYALVSCVRQPFCKQCWDGTGHQVSATL